MTAVECSPGVQSSTWCTVVAVRGAGLTVDSLSWAGRVTQATLLQLSLSTLTQPAGRERPGSAVTWSQHSSQWWWPAVPGPPWRPWPAWRTSARSTRPCPPLGPVLGQDIGRTLSPLASHLSPRHHAGLQAVYLPHCVYYVLSSAWLTIQVTIQYFIILLSNSSISSGC